MPDTKITALTAIGANPIIPSTFPIPMVDLTDTSMAASGTTKKVTVNQILGAGGTATLASATITGDLTVDTNTLYVNSSTDRVSIGTLSALGSAKLSIAGKTQADTAVAGDVIGNFNNTSATGYGFRIGGGSATGGYALSVNNNAGSEFHQISGTGIATWSNVGGVAGTAMTLNATGLGVGLAPANDKLLVSQTIGLVTSTTSDVNFRNIGNTTIQRIRYDDSTGTLTIGSALATAYPVQIGGDTTSRAVTIDASGNLLVGTTDTSSTSGAGFKIIGSGLGPYVVNAASTNAALAYTMYSTGAAAYRFYVGWGGTVFATNTTISAISDQRLKENVQDIDVGLGAILALKPRKFDWKEGKGKNIKGDRGFIAQEFEQVFPQLVDEWKDAAPEGEAPYKSVRQDLIPVLVKAIQELTARVQTLETR